MKTLKVIAAAGLIGILGASAAFAGKREHLPIEIRKPTRLERGRYITTLVTISDGNPVKIHGTIRVENKVALSGFRGTSLVSLKDSRGNIIYRFYSPALGVNGEYLGFSDRTEAFEVTLPDIIADHVRSIDIENMRAPRQPLDLPKENLKKIKELMGSS